MSARPAASPTDAVDPVDAALLALAAVRSTDPAARRPLHVVRIAEHTLVCHVRPFLDDEFDRTPAGAHRR